MGDINNPRLYNMKEPTLTSLFRITYVPDKLTSDCSGTPLVSQYPTKWTCQTTHMRPVIHRYMLYFDGTRSGAARTTRGLQPESCKKGRTPDNRSHDNIVIHLIGHPGQRQRTNYQRTHHAVARHDPDGIPRRQQKHARTHPYLAPVQVRPLHCGGCDTLPGQDCYPAITP